MLAHPDLFVQYDLFDPDHFQVFDNHHNLVGDVYRNHPVVPSPTGFLVIPVQPVRSPLDFLYLDASVRQYLLELN
jgi:hypothetical protein